MSSLINNLSNYDASIIPSAEAMIIGIVVAEWNKEITNALADGAISTLIKHGAKAKDIIVKHVPGSFELPLGAQFLLEDYNVDAVIALGCIIQGETRHFDFISQGVTQGIMQLNIDYGVPVVFGVLTTNNKQQALDRAGGKHGNKGIEAAITAIKMIDLSQNM